MKRRALTLIVAVTTSLITCQSQAEQVIVDFSGVVDSASGPNPFELSVGNLTPGRVIYDDSRITGLGFEELELTQTESSPPVLEYFPGHTLELSFGYFGGQLPIGGMVNIFPRVAFMNGFVAELHYDAYDLVSSSDALWVSGTAWSWGGEILEPGPDFGEVWDLSGHYELVPEPSIVAGLIGLIFAGIGWWLHTRAISTS